MKWDDAKKIINSDPQVIKELDNNAIESVALHYDNFKMSTMNNT